MKDYYQILGVDKDADEDEIRSRYRRLAMEYHPDRNPDDPQAEEKFKEVAEAYGVLTDPVKRREYDTWQKVGGNGPNPGDGFHYSQEEILKDLFGDPRFQQLFQGLLREFQRSGFRSNSQFVRKSFFGGKGGMIFGGLFLFGSLAGPHLLRSAKKNLPGKQSILKTVGSTINSLLNPPQDSDVADQPAEQEAAQALTYRMALTEEEMRDGKTVRVATTGPDGQELLKVSIPPASRHGQKLRLKGKGLFTPHGRGDLFLVLELK